MATKAIKVQVDERLAGEIADKAVKAWHATNYSNGKRRVSVTFEEVNTAGARVLGDGAAGANARRMRARGKNVRRRPVPFGG